MQDKYKVGDTEAPNIINADNSEPIDVFVDGVKTCRVGEVHLGGGYIICLDDERSPSKENESKRLYFKMVTIEKEVKLVSQDSGKEQTFYFWPHESHQD